MTQITQTEYQKLLKTIALKKDSSTNINVRALLEENGYVPVLRGIAVLPIKSPVSFTLDGLTIENCPIMQGLQQTMIISNCNITDSSMNASLG